MIECLSQETALRQYGEEKFKEGYEEGFKEGFEEGKLEAVLFLLKSGIITEEEAASGAGLTVDAFRKAVKLLPNTFGLAIRPLPSGKYPFEKQPQTLSGQGKV